MKTKIKDLPDYWIDLPGKFSPPDGRGPEHLAYLRGFVDGLEKAVEDLRNAEDFNAQHERKIVQIAAGEICLCSDGSAWRLFRGYDDNAMRVEQWERLPPIPQGDAT